VNRLGLAAHWRSQLGAAGADAGAVYRMAAELVPLTTERSDLGSFAGPRHRQEPAHRWLSYKEAFSPGLVRNILDHWSNVDGPLLDPFAGSGTTVLVAVERDVPAIGVEMLAYPQWAANTAVAARNADIERLRDIVESVARVDAGHQRDDGVTLAAPAASWALSPEVTRKLLAMRTALPERGSSIEADLAHLALLTTVETVSTAVKDGTSLRHRARDREGRTRRPGRKGLRADGRDVEAAFRHAGKVIADDLPKLSTNEAMACVLRADARRLPLRDGSIGGAIFSPPYPNRYDYAAIYQLELAVGGFVDTTADLSAVRKSLLRSHLEAPAPVAPELDDPLVVDVLRSVAVAAELTRGDAGRTLRMLVGYFDDMRIVFAELARVLRPGAPAACVVATQTYFGAAVPTDLMLASLAQRAGLAVEGLWVLRRKRVAVQQRARCEVTSDGGREGVLLVRRPD
jgi:hypothetical protein